MFAVAQSAATTAGSAVRERLEVLLHWPGTHPQNSLPLMSTVVSGSAPRLGGIEPDSWLLLTSKRCRAAIPLHSAGSGPVSALPASATSTSRARRPQLAGSVPETLLPSPPIWMRDTSTVAPSTPSASSGSASGAVGCSACRSSVSELSSHVTYVHVQKSVPVHTSVSVEAGVTKPFRNASVLVCSASV
ncbi:hypothetical protein NESM_000776800 [Novymonas esmeraldas]|uniref:C2H2-type domain-containing protein n=1 Tax=Novymonas esmeraldas TaxID=1808958 RepID=A0AAW0EYK4_9TRYP